MFAMFKATACLHLNILFSMQTECFNGLFIVSVYFMHTIEQ